MRSSCVICDAAEISALASTASLELAREELEMLQKEAGRRPVLKLTATLRETPAPNEYVLTVRLNKQATSTVSEHL